jgi:hypothetical protein
MSGGGGLSSHPHDAAYGENELGERRQGGGHLIDPLFELRREGAVLVKLGLAYQGDGDKR